MVIIPLGLTSKTKNIPFATALICAVTVFFSIIKFPENEIIYENYLRSAERVNFGLKARSFLLEKCEKEKPQKLCADLKKIPLRTFSLGHRSKQFADKSLANAFIADELARVALKKSNPQLYQIQEKADQKITSVLKKLHFLSKETVSPISALKTLFTHSGWIHLIGNMLILIFLAIPVEERMGSFLFAMTYLFSGMAGSLLQVFLSTDALYIVGASSSISGVAGALTYFFWRHKAKIWVSYFFMFSQVVVIPVIIYTPVFMVAGDIIGLFDESTNVGHFAHLGGFLMGGFLAFLHNKMLPLPQNFTYPFELNFLEQSRKSLSQMDRLRVFSQWLYYSPVNIFAFKHFVSEINRSNNNPKTELIVNHFKRNIFPEVYECNKKKVRFINLLPVNWLHLLAIGDDPVFLKKTAAQYEIQRDFVNAFKLYFLLLNEIGWRNEEYGRLLFKNYKKSTINKKFIKLSEELAFNHPPFRSFLERKGIDHVSDAS